MSDFNPERYRHTPVLVCDHVDEITEDELKQFKVIMLRNGTIIKNEHGPKGQAT